MTFDPSKFTATRGKPLPVFLLLDVSGSMNEVIRFENPQETDRTHQDDGRIWEVVNGGTSKIHVLNDAVRQMLDSFSADERLETEFLVSIITFGDTAASHCAPSAASSVKWLDMQAGGATSMGAAFALAKELVESKDVIPSRAYRPSIVLVSDGQPTDDWQGPLDELITKGRSSKCFFMAMGIGEDPGAGALERFISQTPVLAEVNGAPVRNAVFHATDADRIHEFFRKVTMSVTTRSKSHNPNDVPKSTGSAPEDQGGYW